MGAKESLDLGGAGLHGAKDFIPDDGGINNDEGGVGVDEAFEEKIGDGFLNDGFAFGPIKGEAAGPDAVV